MAARGALAEGLPAIRLSHFTVRYTLEDDGGNRTNVVHEYSGSRARQIGAGLVATALLACLWLLPTLWPGWRDSSLWRDRFLRFSLGAASAALLLIWPPWLALTSGIPAATYLFLIAFAVWRRLARGIEGRRREELRGQVFLLSFMTLNVLGLLLFGTDALAAAWIGAAVTAIIALHFSMLRRPFGNVQERSGPDPKSIREGNGSRRPIDCTRRGTRHLKT